MELKDFISNTIYEICMGIEDAKARIYDEIKNNPIAPAKIDEKDSLLGNSNIEFDLSITTSSENSSDKKAGLIKVVEANVGKSQSSSQEAMNRVSFSVPFFPQAISEKKK